MKIYLHDWFGLGLGIFTLIAVFTLKLNMFPAITGGLLIGQFIGALPYKR